MLAAQPLDEQARQVLDEDFRAWGIDADPEPEPEVFEVWDEHREALLWWCQGGAQLTFNGPVCTGLDVVAVQADAQLSGRTIDPDDYQRLQAIARQVTQWINQSQS